MKKICFTVLFVSSLILVGCGSPETVVGKPSDSSQVKPLVPPGQATGGSGAAPVTSEESMKGSRLPILLLLLIVAGGGYWLISAKRAADYLRSPAGIQESLQARTRLSGAINQTIIRVQKQTQQWPKNLAEIRNEPELKEFSDHDFEGVVYLLKDVKENVATYEIDFKGRKNTNKMAAWRPGFEKPPSGPAGMAAAGG